MQNKSEFNKLMNVLPLKRTRLPYAAVPLEPWRAKYPGEEDELYSMASQHHIAERLKENFLVVLADGLIRTDHRTSGIYNFVEGSLYDAQRRRIDYNNDHRIAFDPDSESEEYIQAALDGTATPEELLRLALEYSLPSLELAKLSHPFDFKATLEMNSVMLDVAVEHDFLVASHGEYTYKCKRLDRELSSMIVVRKNVFASKVEGDEIVEIVRRESLLLLDGNNCDLVNNFILATDGVVEDDDKESKERYAVAANEILDGWAPFLDAMLKSDEKDDLDWLFPTTTSFYLRRRPIDSAQQA